MTETQAEPTTDQRADAAVTDAAKHFRVTGHELTPMQARIVRRVFLRGFREGRESAGARQRLTGQVNALRAAITAHLTVRGPSRPGLSAGRLAEYTGWSESAVRRELDRMEQLRLVRSYTPKRTRLWALANAGGN